MNAASFKCEDCIGMAEHGCYCAAMGAAQPGGPIASDEPYTGFAPCPHCFESSGYLGQIIPATWTDPAYEDRDYSRRCPDCEGTGMVECEPRGLDDIENEAAELDQSEGR